MGALDKGERKISRKFLRPEAKFRFEIRKLPFRAMDSEIPSGMKFLT